MIGPRLSVHQIELLAILNGGLTLPRPYEEADTAQSQPVSKPLVGILTSLHHGI